MKRLKQYFIKRRINQYRENLKNYSYEDLKNIFFGRKVKKIFFTTNINQIEEIIKEKSGLDVKLKYCQNEKMKEQKSNLTDSIRGVPLPNWICVSRSRNPSHNLDLYLEIGKLKPDYLIGVTLIGGDAIQRLVGIPVKIQ